MTTSLSRFLPAFALAAVFATSASGAILVPQPVSAGFNEDIVASGTGSAAANTSTTYDRFRVLYSEDFANASTYGGGLPANGFITSANGSGNQYQLADYTQNNALLMKGQTSGALTFQNPDSFTQIGLLAASAEGASNVSFTLNFAGGGTQSGNLAIADWWNGADAVIQGVGRVHRTSGVFDGLASNNPRLYEYIIDVDAALQNESLVSISFSNQTSGANAAIFAVSAIPEPSTYAALFGVLAALFILRRRRA
ncbi:MAG: PEP-CTERM sorting domain-containing protein [Opitutales bacterium]|nr:PEP-CTERM sorting domain-containing protein [Opitutales bacterium]